MPPKNQPVTAAEVQHLEKAMGSLMLKDDLILRDAAPRPGYGTAGQKIDVQANMFQARFHEAPNIYHYDVDIVPVAKVANQKMPKRLAEVIFKAAKQVGLRDPDAKAFQNAAFDNQKNAYTTTQFAVDSAGKRTVRVELPEPGREMTDRRRFDVHFRLANKIDLEAITRFCQKNKQSTQEGSIVATALQAVSIMLREEPSKKYTPLGARGRFFGLANAQDLPGGAQVLSGFHQAFRHTSNGLPAIQVDTAYTAVWKSGFLSDNVGDYLGIGGGGGGRGGRGGGRGGRGGGRGGAPGGGHSVSMTDLDQRQSKALKRLLYGAKFTLPYKNNDRVYTLKGISHIPASEVKFMMQSQNGQPDQEIGLVQYYKQHLSVNITKPRLPCVIYGKNFMAPFELVHINDFNPVPFAAMSSDQTAAMIKVAAARPMDRAANIKRWRQQLAYENSALLKAWGLQVKPDMMRLEARVLPGPRINYKGGKSVNLVNGGWNLKPNNGPAMTFTRPGKPLRSWAILCAAPRLPRPFVEGFTQQLVRALQQYGVAVANTKPDVLGLARIPGSGNTELHDSLTTAARTCYQRNKEAPQLIVVILPFKDAALYKEVKTITSMKLKANVVTQCLVADKLQNDRGIDQYLGNVSMKIQSKLGGVTHEVNVPGVDSTTLVMGADVTHPGGGLGRLNPSIAVTVGSMSGDNVTYQVDCRLQDSRQEVIGDLKGMAKTHITTFMANNKGIPPAKIIMFRDGVSDGQWQIVKDREATAIRAAAAELKPGYKPKLTFVICAKRHNMRFFAIEGVTNPKFVDQKNGNLPPGTVVDKEVTHPFVNDFYLQAHHGLQGTARPTHYVVVEDDNKFTADQMQVMCNAMCSTYQRATRSVSIVPVAYNAHNAAELIRLATYVDDTSDGATSVSGQSGAPPAPMVEFSQAYADRLRESGNSKLGWYM